MKIKITGLIFFFLILPAVQTAYAETVFVFNPEARVSEIERVRYILQNHLKSNKIKSDIYVFANPDDFENMVGRLKPDISIVASYYYHAMKSKYKWDILLSGYKKNNKTFNKVLVTSLSIKAPLQLRNKSLAAVSLGASSISYIDSQLPSGLTGKDVRVVTVSKDIDAIMALGFAQVEAAIVTKASFDKLRRINPDVVRKLHILQELKPVEYSKVVAFPNIKNVGKLRQSFQEMAYKGPTKDILRFFDVTEFRP